MYQAVAKKIVNFLVRKEIIKEEEKEIYTYGYEVVIAQSVYILLMIVIACVCSSLIETILFFIGFYVYRSVAGGYHAKTYLKCHMIFALNQILFTIMLHSFLDDRRYVFILLTCVAVITITLICAPIDHPNKPFTSKEKRKFRKWSHSVSIAFVTLMIIAMFVDGNNVYGFCISAGVCSASLSLLYAYIERRVLNAKN